MKKLKSSVSILLSVLMLVSIFTSLPANVFASENKDSNAKPKEAYSSNMVFAEEKNTESNSCKEHKSKGAVSRKKASKNKALTGDEQEYVYGDFSYKVSDDGKATITKYNGTNSNVTVPSEIEGHTVTTLAALSFSNCDLSSINLPKTLTTMEAKVFEGNKNLKELKVPNSIKTMFSNWDWRDRSALEGSFVEKVVFEDGTEEIPAFACAEDASLKEVVIPQSVTIIKNDAFRDCGSLTENGFSLPSGLTFIGCCTFMNCNLSSINLPKTLTTIEAKVFEGNKNLKELKVPNSIKTMFSNWDWRDRSALEGSFVEKVVFEDGTEEIPAFACAEDASLKEVVIPQSVTIIKNDAFRDCGSLTENGFSLPSGLTFIGCCTFMNCDLSSIHLPKTLTTIEAKVFEGNKNLKELKVPNSIKTMFSNWDWRDRSALEGSFVEKVVFEDGTEEIPAFACAEDASLKEVVIPQSVTIIKNDAFRDCGSLTENGFSLPSGLTFIGCCTFMNCDLSSIHLPKTLTTIEAKVFEGNKNLKELKVPNSIKTMFSNWDWRDRSALEGSFVEKVVFEDGTEEIPAFACAEDASLKEVVIPQSVTIIKNDAFRDCGSLTENGFSLPSGLTFIGCCTFMNCNLSSINLPKTLTTIEAKVFEGNKNLKELKVPNSIKTMFSNWDWRDRSALEGSFVEKVVFEDGTEEIPAFACAEDASLKEVVIPQSVTIIKNDAFRDCGSLTENGFSLPSGLTFIGCCTFMNCDLSSIHLPKTLTTIEAKVFEGNKNLKELKVPNSIKTMFSNWDWRDRSALEGSFVEKVVFEDGIKEIPKFACAQVQTLKEVDIPESVTTIGDCAFDGCTNLESVELSDKTDWLGSNCFRDCEKLTVICDYYSNAIISCIDQGVSFAPSNKKSTDDSNKVISREESVYYANTNSLSANGTLPFRINLKTKEKWNNSLSNNEIVIYIPESAELDESTLRVDGELAHDFDFNANKRRLYVPISANSCEITYNLKVNSKEKIISYAFLSSRKDETDITEVIGVINEEYSGISINCDDVISKNTFNVSGIANPESVIELYIDDIKQCEVESLKNGAYSATLTIENPTDGYPYSIKAKSVDKNQNTISAQKSVVFAASSPTLKGLELDYYEHETLKKIDMFNNTQITPKVYFMPGTEFTFVAQFENTENLDSVFITSTRNNEKKSIEAVYDASTGNYVAKGFFDPENERYVPGTIGVEYNEKKPAVVPSEDFNVSPYLNILNSGEKSAQVEYQKNTDKEVEATVDWSEYADSAGKGIVKSSLKYIDTEAGTPFTELNDYYGIGEKYIKYVVPGEDGKSYVMNIDFSDTETLNMFLYDTVDAGLTVADKVISTKLDFTEFGSAGYTELFDWSNRVSNVSKAVGFAYKAYNINKDYEELITEIDQSSTIVDKAEARKKAQELRQDQLAFLAMTTVLPIIAAGTGMAAPILVFGVLIAGMTAASEFFFNARVAKIKGQKFKLNWVVDPSGYIYDADTQERIEDAQVSAYWIPYDENNEDFWDKKPSDYEYGTLWDAKEYQQENPLRSNIDGKYAWDVPEGWWRVKCEKEGYSTVWSDWMTVPPIQLDVNLAIKKNPNGSTPIEETTQPIATEPFVTQPSAPKPAIPKVTSKKANPIKVTVKKKTVKLKKLKKKAQKVKAITVKNNQGKLTYKLVKSGITKKIRKLVKINSKGVITIKKWKKAKKGAYRIKVKITAAGNINYNAKTITKTIKIKVK